jgi:hypothetical protein
MNVKTAYLAFCILGTIVPYWQFVPWLFENGPDGAFFLRELFVNRISAFFGLDVIISALALLVFIRVESIRLGIRRRWLPVAAVLTVGVSLALPLFLYMRELELEQHRSPG